MIEVCKINIILNCQCKCTDKVSSVLGIVNNITIKKLMEACLEIYVLGLIK